jgi:hypothetical protein
VARTPYLQALEFSTISAIETLVKFVLKKGQNPYQKKHLAMLTTPAVFKSTGKLPADFILQEAPYLRLFAPKQRLEFLYLHFFTDFSVFSEKSLHS